ncbi:ATP-binding cassette domain-containing protein [Fodinicurvata sp. EGI_FJ10296]|uniref:phosphonate ABC transporter ATP-binding protein n=1 Tax=Fodinicurvata sp. EGI_FJ10296 TaxID=3231908 RepID=UPI0034556D8A
MESSINHAALDEPAISAANVHCGYGDLHVLRGIDLTVGRAEGVVLLGANGCGKSTFMRCIAGLERVTAGTIRVDGTDIVGSRPSTVRSARRRIGYVFQHFNLVAQLSAFQNVLFGVMGQRPMGIVNCFNLTASRADRERAMNCLDRVGMAGKANSRPTELSGGQQQRVAIARMLMQAPRVVIADEPIASLDPRAGREVLDLLWCVADEEKIGLLCTLHQLELAREYGKRVVGMKAGRIVLDRHVDTLHEDELTDLYRGVARVDESPAAVPAQPADQPPNLVGTMEGAAR